MVPYKGGGPVVNDLLGGHIDVAAVPLSIVRSHVDAGKVKLLGLASRSPFEGYAGVPLMKNKYPKWEEFDGFAFVAEKNVDKDALTWWTNFLKEYLNDESVKKDFAKELTVPVEFGTENLERTIKSSMKRLQKNAN
jgi:tripartite-type tricarboxylate transporter receptor subunit TctC